MILTVVRATQEVVRKAWKYRPERYTNPNLELCDAGAVLNQWLSGKLGADRYVDR